MSHNIASHHMRTCPRCHNSQGGSVMKNACLPFITAKRETKDKRNKRQEEAGAESKSDSRGKEREVYMKNKTFPLITFVTSRLYSGIILNIFEDAEYILMRTLNQSPFANTT